MNGEGVRGTPRTRASAAGKAALLFSVLTASMANRLAAEEEAPDGLMVSLLRGEMVRGVTDTNPKFSWVVHSSSGNDVQSAYRVLVSSDPDALSGGRADMWDSGRTASSASILVEYRGRKLSPDRTYHWKVKTWTKRGGESPWSRPQGFATAPAKFE